MLYLPAHAQQIALSKLYFRLGGHERKKVGFFNSTMANSFATLSRSGSSRPLLLFMEALLLRKAAQTPMHTEKLFYRGRLHRHQYLLGSSSTEEGCTDTNT